MLWCPDPTTCRYGMCNNPIQVPPEPGPSCRRDRSRTTNHPRTQSDHRRPESSPPSGRRWGIPTDRRHPGVGGFGSLIPRWVLGQGGGHHLENDQGRSVRRPPRRPRGLVLHGQHPARPTRPSSSVRRTVTVTALRTLRRTSRFGHWRVGLRLLGSETGTHRCLPRAPGRNVRPRGHHLSAPGVGWASRRSGRLAQAPLGLAQPLRLALAPAPTGSGRARSRRSGSSSRLRAYCGRRWCRWRPGRAG
ncbi:hypothetical protein QFZ58_006816 [Streptomyces sp. B1I3]|nr:hypothetical protein [Streptomyces sp. B1I3]